MPIECKNRKQKKNTEEEQLCDSWSKTDEISKSSPLYQNIDNLQYDVWKYNAYDDVYALIPQQRAEWKPDFQDQCEQLSRIVE